jgi:predicted nucleic acid-binding protein
VALVIDAAAVAEVLLGSPLAGAVAAQIQDSEVFVPASLDIEVLLLVQAAELAGRISARVSTAAANTLAVFPAHRVEVVPLIADAWAKRANLPVDLACYVALAARRAIPLVSADPRLAGLTVTACDVLYLG